MPQKTKTGPWGDKRTHCYRWFRSAVVFDQGGQRSFWRGLLSLLLLLPPQVASVVRWAGSCRKDCLVASNELRDRQRVYLHTNNYIMTHTAPLLQSHHCVYYAYASAPEQVRPQSVNCRRAGALCHFASWLLALLLSIAFHERRFFPILCEDGGQKRMFLILQKLPWEP